MFFISNWLRTLVYGVICFIKYYIFCQSVYIHNLDCISDIILPDIGFMLVQDLRSYPLIYIIKETMGLLVMLIFFLGTETVVLMRMVVCYLTLLMIRNFLFIATIFPDPSGKCTMFDILNPLNGSCHDLVISGHSGIIFIIMLFIFYYDIYPKWMKAIISIIGIIQIVLILALRQHYTVDILNALFYSVALFFLQHAYIVIE